MPPAPPIELLSFRPGIPRAYRLAGVDLLTDIDLPVLQTYRIDGPAAWSAEREAPDDDGWEPVFDGRGLIVDGQRRVVCLVSAAGYRLEVDGIGAWWIAPDGRRIVETAVDPRCEPEIRAMAALGAPLVLALALRGTFCIHASAVIHGGKTAAFIGESGAGKSTLARYLDREGGPDWRRLIDDTLPIAPPDPDAPATALPHFPQPKLPDAMQPSRLGPERLPLSAIYVLESDGDGIAIVPLRQSEATLALAAQTVGSRLFGRALLAGHIDFCVDLAARVPVKRLIYPREFATLPAVQAALAADLAD